jgi:hypothetical protein
VESASVSTTYFPPFGGFDAQIEIQGATSLSQPQAMLGLVSPDLFRTLKMQLLRGRIFDDAENARAAHVALVNQSFVKQYLAGADPIGHSVRSPMLKVPFKDLLVVPEADSWLQIIGVVSDAKNDGLDRPVKPAVFLPYSFVLTPDLGMMVRTAGDPATEVTAIKRRLQEINGEVVVHQDRTLLWWLDTRGWGQERFIATLFSLFAGLALALAAAGLYSVVSFGVTQRTQELGIRMALGAQRTNVVKLVLSSTTAMLAVGVAVGLTLSVVLNRVLSSLAGGSSRDPLTLLAASAVLLMISAVACVVPAWRAASVNPMEALRTE